MNFVRKNIMQPEDYWKEFQAAAEAANQNLSEWIAEQCLKSLPKDVVSQLPVRDSIKGEIFKRRAQR